MFSYKKSKERYTQLLPNYPRFEIAESFFNSVYCRLFHHRELNKKNLFVFHHNLRIVLRKPLALYQERLLYKVIYPHYCKIFYRAYLLRLPWQNKSRDIQFICQTLYAQFSHEELQNAVFHIANELFYRNKAAWMIGKIAINNQFIPCYYLFIILNST